MAFSRTLACGWLLLAAAASSAPAQGRRLHWRSIAVDARLDAAGGLHVREREAMVFTGDWNGGERRFRVEPWQRFEFERLARVDPVTGEEHPMRRDDLAVVHAWDFTDAGTLRWRSRLASDPPFDETERVYVLEFSYSNVLVPIDSGYVLDHDFAFADRAGVIEEFTLTIELDSVWSAPSSFRGSYRARDLPPGEGFVVRVPLRYTAAGRPAGVEFGAGPAARTALGLALLAGIIALLVRLFARERSLGRFEPLIPSSEITQRWLDEHVFAHPPEVVGTAWDVTTGAPEVTAVLARLEAEGKLQSEVEVKGRGFLRRHVLHLRLRAPRERFNDYERALIDSLFSPGDVETSTEAVRKRYQKSGFDPAEKLKAPLKPLANALSGGRAAAAKPSWKPTAVLLLVTLALVIAGIVARPYDGIVMAIGGLAFLVLYIVALIGAVTWRSRVHDLGRTALAFLIPIGLGVLGLLVLLLAGPTRTGALVLAGLTTLALALFRSVSNQAMSREHAERIAVRKRLASARAYFRDQLEQPRPVLRDEWFPWLIAFGLAKHMDQWFRAFGGGAERSGVAVVPAATSGRTSSGGSGGWTGFGGGGGFSGGGASAAWTAAAGSLAAGVSAPGSSGSGGGG
ncbi:MAG TPA: hypothetical protein VLE53_16955, partial [Gemmatimonadaceae bacterium]|nr:hypothetical protein [Gemmatimonadaceae bacterium]